MEQEYKNMLLDPKNLGKPGSRVNAVALIKDSSIRKTKTDKDYLVGTMAGPTGNIGFKIWGGELLDSLKGEKLAGKVVLFQARVDEYQGTISLVVEGMEEVEGAGASDIIAPKYDVEGIEARVIQKMEKELSPEGLEIFYKLWESVGERYKAEFAGRSMHDANPGGLLGHSYKCLNIMTIIVKTYSPGLMAKCDKDLLMLGVFFHDVGKVREYQDGQFTEIGQLLMHDYLGAKELEVAESLVREKKGEEWWYRLVSVCMQHHGEFGSRPRTPEAYAVHLVDMFESRLTILDEKLEGLEKGETLMLDGNYLT